ncbi:MAG: hypothetical protein COU32_00260 [Candidatus Magasanikbacteria bacterium CG10_big_fil_rev_8_21_14_0_10_42_10]|uniref:Uncharacterized protein n=2 Tax=Candidatus Magasanikiibacteriota TaxID=1752731 RepID=A0A2H0TZ36_9BACT|nr:MAG: hypothetical protein COU32_00260 [Candidatus Magasanikbacteria bacterium CG10_big_fil_rev_8_21_14_0_10_42_10]PIZ94446.1 MAG: hypothetical protein COX82_00620 [Candidatus Magasanikbacteria bacterium CG_4_10_14_0_2_um_filter_41_10]
MSIKWIILILFCVGALFVYTRFKKTKLLSNFPFAEEENSIFEEKPLSLSHKIYPLAGPKKNFKYHVLMRPLVKVTNKKRIIFAQTYKHDAIVYGVFSMNALTDSEQTSWKDLGYAFATLSPDDITATSGGKKAQYEITFTAHMQENIVAVTGEGVFVMQVYTNDIAGYEKALGIKIPVS